MISNAVPSHLPCVVHARAAQAKRIHIASGGRSPVAVSRGSVGVKTSLRRGKAVVVRAEEEKKDTMSSLDAMLEGDKKEAAPAPPEALYDDGQPQKPKNEMSMEQRKKLRDEYLSLGGSPNQSIPNYFLYIIVVISALAVASALTGAI
mmetsp:Transcript_28914/g.55364  ORF Transcript_28914/g.55364 Transcript_28914/m.55364 type:complete len:148 (-) Transcript_28914:218-661(-)